MPISQRILRVSNLGVWLMFTILNQTTNPLYKPKDVRYDITPRSICGDGIFLEVVDNQPVIIGKSMEEIEKFFLQNGFDKLPGQLPCQPYCVQCAGKCLAQAA